MDVTAITILLAISVFLGALVQGSVGFGFALIVVPTMAIVKPESLPGTVLLLALPLTSIIAVRERHSLDLPGFYWVTGGRLLGIVAGLGLLVAVPPHYLTIITGGIIEAAVIMNFFVPDFAVRNRIRLLGGFASGVMGTVAAIGGPPLAFVYKNRPGPELRATLTLSFALGIMISLLGLIVVGKLADHQLRLALLLLPAALLGTWTSRFTSSFLDKRWLQPAILIFAAASGLLVMALEWGG